MPAISPSANAARSGFQQAVSPQLRHAAEQAQQAAEALQMQARQAWQKVDLAEANARAVDAQANQARTGADKARQDMLSFGQGVLAASKATPAEGAGATSSTTGTGASASASASPVTVQPIAYTASAAVIGIATTARPTGTTALNGMGQRIGSMINIAA